MDQSATIVQKMFSDLKIFKYSIVTIILLFKKKRFLVFFYFEEKFFLHSFLI